LGKYGNTVGALQDIKRDAETALTSLNIANLGVGK
jgi:hypothetical protein